MTDQKFCQSCGAALQPGANFCPACGTKVAAQPAPAKKEKPAAPAPEAAPAAPAPQAAPAASPRAPIKLPDIRLPMPGVQYWIGLAVIICAVVLGLLLHGGSPEESQGDVAGIPAQDLVKSAVLAKGVTGDSRPQDPTEVFSPGAKVLYCVYELGEAARGRQFHYAWTADQVSVADASNQVISEETMDIASDAPDDALQGVLQLELPGRSWPQGDYHLDLYVAERKVMTLPFRVAGGGGARLSTTAPSAPAESSRKSSGIFSKLEPVKEPINIFNPDVVLLYTPRAIKVPRGMDADEVEDAILEAMDKVGWRSHKTSSGHIEGTFQVFSKRATIDVRYSSSTVKISYRSSKNLDYKRTAKGKMIKELYNKWVRDLESAIKGNLNW
jgi:hypothetical protein